MFKFEVVAAGVLYIQSLNKYIVFSLPDPLPSPIMPPPQGPYNYGLPLVRHSLKDFVVRAKDLSRDNVDDALYQDFLLTGVYSEDGVRTQAFLDPLSDHVQPQEPLNISRDYDSLLGICADIVVTCDLSMFAIPHPTFALKSSIHVKYDVIINDVEESLDYHKIPNFELGRFGPRHHIHAFFPLLAVSQRRNGSSPHQLTRRERQIIYEHGIRPAIEFLLGDQVSEWPATLETEEIRAKKHLGGYAFATKVIPSEVVEPLAQIIRGFIQSDPELSAADRAWASDIFFLHTVRGTKNVTSHRVEVGATHQALEDFLASSHLPPDLMSRGTWYIDVAIEIISASNRSLQWVASKHSNLVQEFLVTEPRHAQRITSIGSSKYAIDVSSHITGLAGMRCSPGVLGQGQYQCKYVQLYTTDKAVVYNIDYGHHAKFLTTKEAMADRQPAPTISGLHTIYEQATTSNPSHARAEMRVPLQFATRALVFLDSAALRSGLCSFDTADWWSFRSHRLTAASQVLSLQASGIPQLRTTPQALALTAACVWLINGLHARPDDHRASRRLMDAVLPVTEENEVESSAIAYRSSLPRVRTVARSDREEGDPDEEEEQEEEEEEDEEEYVIGVAHNPFGVVFFRYILFVDDDVEVPRFHVNGPELPESAYGPLFSMSLAQVKDKYSPTGMVPKSMLLGKRVTTNKRPSTLYVQQTDTPAAQPFDFAAPHRLVPPDVVDAGHDMDDAETPPPPESLNDFATSLLCQFVVDVIGRSPNPRGATNSSYVKLTADERQSVTEEIFNTPILSDIFRSVAYKYGSREDFDKAYYWLFPPRGVKIADNIQNYPSCPYFKRWMMFANDPRTSPASVDEARRAIVERLRSWAWIPDASQDRMWPTSTHKAFTRVPPALDARGKQAPAPRILLRATTKVEFVEDDEDE
ncbi:hypothetical protein H0H93_010371 [Arthromyces matolae]|nr:hypothetical protein H0H93_010371 [Arthromyces matolae]